MCSEYWIPLLLMSQATSSICSPATLVSYLSLFKLGCRLHCQDWCDECTGELECCALCLQNYCPPCLSSGLGQCSLRGWQLWKFSAVELPAEVWPVQVQLPSANETQAGICLLLWPSFPFLGISTQRRTASFRSTCWVHEFSLLHAFRDDVQNITNYHQGNAK